MSATETSDSHGSVCGGHSPSERRMGSLCGWGPPEADAETRVEQFISGVVSEHRLRNQGGETGREEASKRSAVLWVTATCTRGSVPVGALGTW